MKQTLIFSALMLLILSTLYVTRPQPPVITEGTKTDCKYGAELAREAFQGTEFEDWNFYKTCIENIMCSNPTKECPVQLIHEETKDWVQEGK